MTIIDQNATCDQLYSAARAVVVLDGEHSVYVRAHEVLINVRPINPLLTCMSCGKQLVQVRTAWDHRITSDSDRGGPGSWHLGEDPFDTLRHADGTPCGERPRYVSKPDPDHPGRFVGAYEGVEPIYYCSAKPVCPKCDAVDSFDIVQQAYGDTVTCRSCGDSNYYSIGD